MELMARSSQLKPGHDGPVAMTVAVAIAVCCGPFDTIGRRYQNSRNSPRKKPGVSALSGLTDTVGSSSAPRTV